VHTQDSQATFWLSDKVLCLFASGDFMRAWVQLINSSENKALVDCFGKSVTKILTGRMQWQMSDNKVI